MKEDSVLNEKQRDRDMNDTIKVGFCVAYDWNLLANALPLVYNSADAICLSIDQDRLTWANQPAPIDERAFRQFVRSIDVSNKIDIYEDNFHLPELTSAQNEVRQRQLMAARMGSGGWYIQLDCDEYFLDFAGFVRYLKAFPRRPYSFNVCCQFVTLYKKVKDGFLYVDPEVPRYFEFMQVASRTPSYEHGRRNGNFNVLAPFVMVHQSWARSEDEILLKLSNWGHKDDFDGQKYFEFWRGIDETNFKSVRHLHPIHAGEWPSLRFVQCDNVGEMLSKSKPGDFPSLNPVSRFMRNSRFLSALTMRTRSLLNGIIGLTTKQS